MPDREKSFRSRAAGQMGLQHKAVGESKRIMRSGHEVPDREKNFRSRAARSMAIDYSGLRSLTARELIAALLQDGFYYIRHKGSHQRYRHPDGRCVTVAPHGRGDTFAVKTLKSIIELQACWSDEDLKRLKLIK